MASRMAELFDKKEFRAVYGWFLTLDTTSIRSKAYQTGAITYMQKQTLASQRSETHNEKLVDMVREADSRESFKNLAEAVKSLGDAYEPKYQQLMAILDLNKDMADQTKSAQLYRHDVDQAVTDQHTASEAATVGVQRNEGQVRDLAESNSREEKLTTLEVDYKMTYDLRVFELETTTFNGVLIWKFQSFQKHLDKGKKGVKTSHYSQPFYSSPHGYKMCARLYPNGDGDGHGKYVSIFFVIMAGQYDALLKWPFSQRVTLSLMDQSPNQRNISETFMPDIRSTSFQRPTSGMNVASGCPCFASHSLLMGSASYLKNDTIYLRVKIDTHGLDI